MNITHLLNVPYLRSFTIPDKSFANAMHHRLGNINICIRGLGSSRFIHWWWNHLWYPQHFWWWFVYPSQEHAISCRYRKRCFKALRIYIYACILISYIYVCIAHIYIYIYLHDTHIHIYIHSIHVYVYTVYYFVYIIYNISIHEYITL